MPLQKQQQKINPAKLHIIEAAAAVFYKSGYRATGVSEIAKAAGITKATLYHHFKDKDDLIESVLNHLSTYYRDEYEKCWSKKQGPLEKLTALFDMVDRSLGKKDFYGCPFINAASEYTERKTAVRSIAESHYDYISQRLATFAREAGITPAERVAQQISALLAGTYSSWYVAGNNDAAKQSKSLANLLIEESRTKQKA